MNDFVCDGKFVNSAAGFLISTCAFRGIFIRMTKIPFVGTGAVCGGGYAITAPSLRSFERIVVM